MNIPARGAVVAVFLLVLATGPSLMHGQQPPPAAAKSLDGATELNLKATSANVKTPGSQVRLRISRWSTDEERRAIVASMTPPPPDTAPPPPGAAARTAAGAGRGDARGGAGRGAGRGRGAPASPIAGLTAAIAAAPTVGFIWTDEVTGYAIKYAYRTPTPNGGERIILATDRRLGAYTGGWRPVAATPVTDYEFTLFEIRMDAKGSGEGKTSLTTPVIVDNEAKTVALDNYAAAPAILQSVRR